LTDKNQSDTRRNRTEIVIQILDAVADQTENDDGVGVTKTTLMYEVFLNSNQLRKNLSALTAYNLLHYDPAMGTYSITEKGLRHLELWYKINDMANELLEQQQI
jgi:predicted transcriptional regulator